MADDFQIPDWVTQDVRIVHCVLILRFTSNVDPGRITYTVSSYGNSIMRKQDLTQATWMKSLGR